MNTIRHSCFETNSSSSHSISIATKPKYNDIIGLDENDSIILTGGEFGWGIDTFTDALTKANYCAIDFQNNNYLTEMLVDLIKEMTGAKDVIFNLGDSYIDHQSQGVASEEFANSDDLKDFIFCKQSRLVISNDNI